MALSQSEGKAIERSSKSKTRQSETQSKLSKSEFGVNLKIFTQIPVLDDAFGWLSENQGLKHSNFLDPCPQPSKSPLSNIWIAIWMRGARDLDKKASKYPIWIPFGWFYDSLMCMSLSRALNRTQGEFFCAFHPTKQFCQEALD